ncbi:MAG: hypothetical protein H6709_10945 [Kofleriaceae bacterium]|nr:hypothetical protein [Kofleriaceae bacterium]
MTMATETEFAGKGRAKMWTYLIIAGVVLLGAIIGNLAFNNPDTAKHGVSSFLGLPGWAIALVAFLVGAGIYWLGLKIETDWPEFIGAGLIGASLYAFEIIIGWSRFEFGLVVTPYVLPLLVFVILVMVGMKKSV